MKLTNKFELDNCKKKTSYSLIHKTIPLEMTRELWEAISYLLWYVPDIASIQSQENELISNLEYDNYTFLEIMSYMDLRDEDVLFTDKIPSEIENFYKKSICTNSQKLILTQGDNETKAAALLRHIRNAIAHGSFNMVENLIIGFDVKIESKHVETCTAIFKIDPKNLLKALKNINKDLTSKKLVSSALQRCGYGVEDYKEEFQISNRFDLYAKKRKKRYAIEIRNYENKSEIDEGFVIEMINKLEKKLGNIKPLLVINTSFLTEKSRLILQKHELIILDIKNIKKMLNGRDMIVEIEEAHKIVNK